MLGFSLVAVTGRQLRAARDLLGWEQMDLKRHAKVSIGTIRRMESFRGPVNARTETLSKVVTAMERFGIKFESDQHYEVVKIRRP